MAKLTFVLEDGQEVVVPLKEHITIGRDEGNDVVVDDERISPRHAELVQNADGSLQVLDLDSAAGTFVNGRREQRCTLRHGDALAFGPLSGVLDLEEAAQLEAEKARLKAEAERLASFKIAVQEAATAHREWLEAIAALSSQHAEKTAALERLNTEHYEKSTEVRRLAAEETALQGAIHPLTARLQQLRDECAQGEALLASLRPQILALETRLREGQDRAATREEQVKAAEKKIEQLSGSEEKLAQAHTRCQEAEARHATLTTALSAETQCLAETQARRAELETQCEELADTQQKLVDTRQRLAAIEQRYHDVQADASRGSPQLAARPAEQESRAKLEDLTRQIEAAQHELATLEAKTAPLRDLPPPPASKHASPAAPGLPPPRIVHVESPSLDRIPMKSERMRGQA